MYRTALLPPVTTATIGAAAIMGLVDHADRTTTGPGDRARPAREAYLTL